MRIQNVFNWADGWMANELLNAPALRHVGARMDISVESWVPMLASEQYRAFLLSQEHGDKNDNVLIRTVSDNGRERLDVAYHPSMAKVHKGRLLERITALLRSLSGLRTVKTSDSLGFRVLKTPNEISRYALQMDLDFDDMVQADPTLVVHVLIGAKRDPVAAVVSKPTPEGHAIIAWSEPGGEAPDIATQQRMRSYLMELSGGRAPMQIPEVETIPTDHIPDEVLFTVGTPARVWVDYQTDTVVPGPDGGFIELQHDAGHWEER
jgi:hypothetical protein